MYQLSRLHVQAPSHDICLFSDSLHLVFRGGVAPLYQAALFLRMEIKTTYFTVDNNEFRESNDWLRP